MTLDVHDEGVGVGVGVGADVVELEEDAGGVYPHGCEDSRSAAP